MTTDVIFKLDTRRKDSDVTAFFPAIAGNGNVYTCSCYATMGQHSIASVNYAGWLRPAKPEQYRKLESELRSIGYDDLRIVRKFTQQHRAARLAEIEGK